MLTTTCSRVAAAVLAAVFGGRPGLCAVLLALGTAAVPDAPTAAGVALWLTLAGLPDGKKVALWPL